MTKIQPNITVPPPVEKARAARSNQPRERPTRKYHMIPEPKEFKETCDPIGYIYIPDINACSNEMLVDVFQIRYQQYKNFGKYLMENVHLSFNLAQI